MVLHDIRQQDINGITETHMQSNSYQQSILKPERLKSSCLFWVWKPSIFLVTSWMKLSVCLEDGIKKEVLCTHKSPGLQLRTIVKNWRNIGERKTQFSKEKSKMGSSVEQDLGYDFMLGCTNKYSVSMLWKIMFPVFSLQQKNSV